MKKWIGYITFTMLFLPSAMMAQENYLSWDRYRLAMQNTAGSGLQRSIDYALSASMQFSDCMKGPEYNIRMSDRDNQSRMSRAEAVAIRRIAFEVAQFIGEYRRTEGTLLQRVK